MTAIRRRASVSRLSAAASSVRIATAPFATASAAKARPSCCAPRSAANRKPGLTWRESAVRPTIWGSANGGALMAPGRAGGSVSVAGLISSVRFNPLSLHALDRQRPGDRGRCLVDGRHAQYRRDPLDDAAGGRCHGPSGGRETMALLGAVRLVDQGQDGVTRLVHRKRADKRRQQLLFQITATRVLLGGAGLAADHVAGRRRQLGG